MKNSIAAGQDEPVVQQSCSEKKCITCFENGGCMYDQYMIITTYHSEGSHLQKENSALPQHVTSQA